MVLLEEWSKIRIIFLVPYDSWHDFKVLLNQKFLFDRLRRDGSPLGIDR